MVNRTNRINAREIDKLNDKDTAILGYQPLPSQKIQLKDNLYNDDLIASLSNAYENRRAQQVVEWERLYWRNVAA
jgi:diketogulonate reductase-like aldo/keto reductase